MRRRRIATKRAILVQAWFAAQKRPGPLELSADEDAGRLLAEHGSALVAFTFCETAKGREHLEDVVREEGGRIDPLLRRTR